MRNQPLKSIENIVLNQNSNRVAEKRRNEEVCVELIDSEEPLPKRPAIHNISNIPPSTASTSSYVKNEQPVVQFPYTVTADGCDVTDDNQNNENIEICPTEADLSPDCDSDEEPSADLGSAAIYSKDIFLYYKLRQNKFVIGNYLEHQIYLNYELRKAIVDWLVELREGLDFTHETLFLAVKIMDLYLSKTKSLVRGRDLQLVIITSVRLAAKFNNRVIPSVGDLLFMCDDDYYTPNQVRKMELIMFNIVGFDLGIPISVTFLRRFAQIIKLDYVDMTLARYILESSLMFYDFISVKEDFMAAASLLLTMKMNRTGDWDKRLSKCTGYKLKEVEPLMWALNHMIIRMSEIEEINYIYMKYCRPLFYEVAKVSALPSKIPAATPIHVPPNFSHI